MPVIKMLTNPELSRLVVRNYAELLSGEIKLSTRQRIALSTNTELSSEEALSIDVLELTPSFIMSHAITPIHLLAAGLTPRLLARLGCTSAATLRDALGFDALDSSALSLTVPRQKD